MESHHGQSHIHTSKRAQDESTSYRIISLTSLHLKTIERLIDKNIKEKVLHIMTRIYFNMQIKAS